MSFIEQTTPTPSDSENNLLRKILLVLLGGLSGGGAVTGSVSINDGTNAALKAVVTDAAPAADDLGLVVRVAGDTGGAVTIVDGGDVALGATADAAVVNPASSATLIALTKGVLTEQLLIATQTNRIPAQGQALMAASMPVVIASNQTALPVTFSNSTISVTQGTSPWVISNANLDVALSTLALKNQFPTSLGATTKAGSNSVAIATDTYGQATKANSLPVTLASDQGDLPVKVGAATATTGTQTGAGSTTATSIGNYPTVLVSIHGTYGISSGVFEASDDAGTTFYPVFGVRSDLNIIDAGFTSIPANTSRMWTVPVNGASQFRVRTTAVASGTMSISITPIAAAVSDGSVVAVTPSQGTLVDKSGTITSGGAAQTLAAANTARKYLIVQNVSQENLWINFTTTAVQNQPSILLLPNGSFVMEGSYVSTELVSIIGTTTGSTFTAKEG